MTLLVLARDRGERLAVHWRTWDSGAHGVEIAIETASGAMWKRKYSVSLKLSELWLVADGIAKAIEMAKQVRA